MKKRIMGGGLRGLLGIGLPLWVAAFLLFAPVRVSAAEEPKNWLGLGWDAQERTTALCINLLTIPGLGSGLVQRDWLVGFVPAFTLYTGGSTLAVFGVIGAVAEFGTDGTVSTPTQVMIGVGGALVLVSYVWTIVRPLWGYKPPSLLYVSAVSSGWDVGVVPTADNAPGVRVSYTLRF